MTNYSKDEIRSYLESLVEHTLWDTILGEKDVPTLRIQFRDVRSYRNDVMHAHNIEMERFDSARFLLNSINKELDTAIRKRVDISKKKPRKQEQEVNAAISSAIAAMDLSAVSGIFKGASLTLNDYIPSSSMLRIIEEAQTLGASTAMIEDQKAIQFWGENPAMAEALEKHTSFQASPIMEEYNRVMKKFNEMIHPVQIELEALAERKRVLNMFLRKWRGLP